MMKLLLTARTSLEKHVGLSRYLRERDKMHRCENEDATRNSPLCDYLKAHPFL